MGRDSCSKGRGFESWHCILDGHIFTYICCKNCNDVCLKRPKINEKEAGVGPFFLKNTKGSFTLAAVVCIHSRLHQHRDRKFSIFPQQNTTSYCGICTSVNDPLPVCLVKRSISGPLIGRATIAWLPSVGMKYASSTYLTGLIIRHFHVLFGYSWDLNIVYD